MNMLFCNLLFSTLAITMPQYASNGDVNFQMIHTREHTISVDYDKTQNDAYIYSNFKSYLYNYYTYDGGNVNATTNGYYIDFDTLSRVVDNDIIVYSMADVESLRFTYNYICRVYDKTYDYENNDYWYTYDYAIKEKITLKFKDGLTFYFGEKQTPFYAVDVQTILDIDYGPLTVPYSIPLETLTEDVVWDFEGYFNELNDAYFEGKELGYEEGYDDAVIQIAPENNLFKMFKNVFSAIGGIFSIKIAPHITLGMVLGIPVVVGALWFLLKALIQ